ncbi:helix-turn-helix transcriptional regulator [uncultured Ruminococcus sp.]|uniref:helix-turn-helix domain-containing protein n=1 Tax=uncultured Ruminococcus sp. TaxID=165186 RepID=UPI0029301CF7|nr:helix-turn-helix transcriptional regulator [uncultured Ruminococcus sp.]
MSKSKPISIENVDKYVQLGLNIAYYRKLKGITQEQLAEQLSISRSHLSAIEAPNIVKAFSIELLFDIANALQVESYKLLIFRD